MRHDSEDPWPRLPNGLPYKAAAESFGRYWNRITHDEAMQLAYLSKQLGVLPNSFFLSYIPSISGDAP